jgi:hypothetical protein
MIVNQRRYERLHYLFGTFRRDQLDAFHDVLDPSQWLEFMTLYREMAVEAERDEAEHGATRARREEKA